MPVSPYWYEKLGEDEFQKLCDVLIASKFDQVSSYPVGQGRHRTDSSLDIGARKVMHTL